MKINNNTTTHKKCSAILLYGGDDLLTTITIYSSGSSDIKIKYTEFIGLIYFTLKKLKELISTIATYIVTIVRKSS